MKRTLKTLLEPLITLKIAPNVWKCFLNLSRTLCTYNYHLQRFPLTSEALMRLSIQFPLTLQNSEGRTQVLSSPHHRNKHTQSHLQTSFLYQLQAKWPSFKHTSLHVFFSLKVTSARQHYAKQVDHLTCSAYSTFVNATKEHSKISWQPQTPRNDLYSRNLPVLFCLCCLLLSQAFLIDFAFVFLTKETSLHSSMTYIHLKNGPWFQPAKAFLYPFTSIFSNVVMVKHLLFSNLII